MPVIQGICDKLIEVWGEGGGVWSCQRDLVSSDYGGEAEETACLGEQHFQHTTSQSPVSHPP